MTKVLLAHHFSELNPVRKFVQAIVHLLTKDQLKILKSRLQFDPRKLPLTKQALADALAQINEEKYEQLHDRFFQVTDAFQHIVLPEQCDALNGYADHVAEVAAQTDDDNALLDLETLHDYLLDFLESVETH